MGDVLKVLMLETKPGSPDGLHVREYEEGKSYDLPEDLARAFVEQMKVARFVRPRGRPRKETPENPKGRIKGRETPENGES